MLLRSCDRLDDNWPARRYNAWLIRSCEPSTSACRLTEIKPLAGALVGKRWLLVGADPDEPDLEPAHERALSAWAKETHGSDFLAVEGYPMRKRPFYTHPEVGDPRWSASFDLLFRGLELTTGGQRLHRYPDYLAALGAAGEDPGDYTSYLEAFKHGMPPHGGFAIGLERWVARLAGIANVREVALFPRDLHRITP